MSLTIRIDGEDADRTRDTLVNLELTNPYLTYETIWTQKANWPNIPMSVRNRRLFGFADHLQVTSPDRFEIALLYNGHLLQEGVGVLGELSGQGYGLAIEEPLGEFFGIYDGIPLSDIAFGTVPMTSPVQALVTVDGEPALCFPTILNPDFYKSGQVPAGWDGRVNSHDGSSYVAGTPLVPAVFIKFLLKQIAAKTGTTLTGTLLDHPQLSQAIILLNRPLPANATEVTFRYHLPDWSIGELLMQLRKLLNLAYAFKPADRRMSIFLTDQIHRQPASEDWSSKAVKKGKKRSELNKRLNLIFELDSGDQLLKDKPAPVADYLTPIDSTTATSGIAKVSTKLCPLLIDSATGLPIMQIASGTGQPRIAFWAGLQGGLPTASDRTGGVVLSWNGPGGLAETFWSLTERFRNRMFYVERDMLLTETDLARLDFSRRKHINGVDYLVARIVVSLPIRRPAQCLLIRA